MKEKENIFICFPYIHFENCSKNKDFKPKKKVINNSELFSYFFFKIYDIFIENQVYNM